MPDRHFEWPDLPIPPRWALQGRYLVEDVLGAGPHGTVVSARDCEAGRPVAVKILRAGFELLDDQLAELRDAMAQLAGEPLVRIEDAGRIDDGTPYLVMERLHGVDLHELRRERGALPIGEAVDHVLTACGALAEAHRAGLVHGNLKLTNLFLVRPELGPPQARVLDFGLRRLIRVRPEQQHKVVVQAPPRGPVFVSPDPRADYRTDLWALGTLLYLLLTPAPRSPPGPSFFVQGPPRLRALRPDAPAALEAAVHACLARDPGQRPLSAEDLAAQLQPFASGARAG